MKNRKHPPEPLEAAAGAATPETAAGAVPAPPSTPDAETTTLPKAEHDALVRKASEHDAWRDTAQRVQADFVNYQNRMRRERDLDRKYGCESMCRAILPTLDNFDNALAACSAKAAPTAILDGMKLIHRELLRNLELQGVKPLETLGKPFDGAFHEVVTVKETADVPADTIVIETRKGYLLHDRVLRVAQVIVAKAPSVPVPNQG